ncbi:hypothetical protein [Alphaproteobacteria bacterium endosymbiont of Tiliacea citrago]|uniref:hypothetical protein n=1 Tax=Alphaproteobacteria bacterium endosymbiont of Tiliacea citrago TaxID=3077944 RepID=UPI00313EB121
MNKYFKANALGNNFILIQTNHLDKINSNFILKINNYYSGIGANQVLAIDLENNVKIWDEDGSEARLCGNGLRCLAKLLNKPEVVFHTRLAGDVFLKNINDDLVSLQITQKPQLSFDKDHYLVNVGNLNKIFFVQDNLSIDINSYANNTYNYSFISNKENKWHIRTIESCTKQETYACGSAALASAFVLKYLNHKDLTLNYKLGAISHLFENNNLIQIGPAKIIAEILLFN